MHSRLFMLIPLRQLMTVLIVSIDGCAGAH